MELKITLDTDKVSTELKIELAKILEQPAYLDHLSYDDDRVKAAVGGNGCAYKGTLMRLSEYKENWLPRAAVAGNVKAPKDVIMNLSDDPEKMVRAAAAGNPSNDPKKLDKLSYDENYEVRRAVAVNPSTLKTTRERLYNDTETSVWQAAKRFSE